MKIKYVPILRWKIGEKNCLENLTTNVASQIIPFIEVSPPSDSSNDEDAEKKLVKLFSSFNTSWEDKPFYLFLSEDWFSNADSIHQISEIYEDFYRGINHPKAIPAFDIIDEINIRNVTNLSKTNGVCLRISGNNFETLGQTLNDYVTNALITPQSTDLLIDLKYIDEETYPKKAVLTTAISDIANITDYRRVIIASCSFPKDISDLPSYVINEFKRHEVTIHEISTKLQTAFDFNYVYADYGPMNLNEVTFVLGMSPKFKIKYTTKDKYLIIKGDSLKRGGLDLPNVSSCCMQLVNHQQYSGANFSYGDKVISDTANGTNIKGGNLTSWVGYSFNHHITLIVSLL